MARRYDLAMTEPAAQQLSEMQRIAQGYTFDEPAVELGVLMENDAAVPAAVIPHPVEHAEPAGSSRARPARVRPRHCS